MVTALSDLNKQVAQGGMSFEYQSFTFAAIPTWDSIRQFEVAARTCYQSEGKMTEDLSSGLGLLRTILKKNHTAMIEFLPDMIVKIRTNRGVTHELVRMRLCSFAQESTRYVKYGEVPYIIPEWASASSLYESPRIPKNRLFLASCMGAADIYSQRLKIGCSAQEARGSLNNDTASYINVKTNMREWLHIFGLRCDKAAHPDMRVLACGIADWLRSNNDLMAELFSHYPEIDKNIHWFRGQNFVETIENSHYVLPYVDADCNRDAGDPWATK